MGAKSLGPHPLRKADVGQLSATPECFLMSCCDCCTKGWQALQHMASTGAQACWWRRVSAKLFQCSPAKLPADIKHNMVRLLGCGSRSEGYIRPGCVHFTITSTTSHAQARSIKVRLPSGCLLGQVHMDPCSSTMSFPTVSLRTTLYQLPGSWCPATACSPR